MKKYKKTDDKLIDFNILLGSFDSDSFPLYQALNEKIERTTKLLYTICMIVNILVILLASLIVSMINYYYFDLGEKSFVLPYPIW